MAIDPGPEESAFVKYDTETGLILDHGKPANADLIRGVRGHGLGHDHLAIEMIASYGTSVGKSVFETCLWIGRFIEADEACHSWKLRHTLVYRHEVKMHLCHTSNSKDSNVREALIDRWGGKSKAIGTKADRKLKRAATIGPLVDITGDVWSALAVAVTWSDARRARADEWGAQR